MGNKYGIRVGIFIITIIIVATIAVILTIIYKLAPIPSGPIIAFWTTVSLITGLSIIRLPLGGVLTSLGEIVDLAAFASVGPYPILLSNIGSAVGRSIILKRLDPIRDLFNISQWNIACLTAYYIFIWINNTQITRFSITSFVALFGAWFSYSIITTGLVSLIISTTEGGSFNEIWKKNYLREFLISCASIPLALIMAVLFLEYGTTPVLLLVVPLILLSVLASFWMDRNRMLERAERDKKLADMGKATATLLHELSRPMNRIVMISDYAISGGKSHKEALQEILDESLEANRLTEKLKTAFKLNLEKKPLIIGDLVDGLKKKLYIENIPISIESKGSITEMEVLWDPEMVIMALTNLVKNAWESQDSRGQSPNVHITSEYNPAESISTSPIKLVTFIVTDSGHGFPIDVGEDIFDALYSTKVRGLGIGLFLVNQITQAHGGTLSVRNNDIGASIFMSLPIA